MKKSYIFPVVIEPDEDVWRAYVPQMEARGAATWGHTPDEALRNIQEVMQMVVEELLHSDGRRVTLSFHHASDTFRLGTLRSIIEMQAGWSENDLRCLKLLP